MDSDHEKDKLDEESSAYEDYDDEFERLKQDMRDLIKINNNLNVALEENRRHNRSILILTTLMVVCISSMYGYYTMVEGANDSKQVEKEPQHNPLKIKLEKEVSAFFTTDGQYNTLSGDDFFYNTMAMRLRMMPFNAMAIKSPLILHDKLGLVGGGIASGAAVGLRGALKSIPIVGTAYMMFEMGVRAATDKYILQNVANNSLNFFDSVNPIFYMKFSVRLRKNEHVQQLIDNCTKKWDAESTHRHWKLGKTMNKDAKENKRNQEIVAMANKFADYLSRIIVTGYAQKVFLECYDAQWDNSEEVCYELLCEMTVNHPKGHRKISLNFNKAAKEEDKRRSDRLMEFLNNDKNKIPDHVRDSVLEYWNIASKGNIKIQLKAEKNKDGDEEIEMEIVPNSKKVKITTYTKNVESIPKKEYNKKHNIGLINKWKNRKNKNKNEKTESVQLKPLKGQQL